MGVVRDLARHGRMAIAAVGLLEPFQGMFAEYEKARLMERYRRGRAPNVPGASGSVKVLSGAPFGYGTSARPSALGPLTRSPGTRRCWSLRCSAARRRVCGPH
jgi:hypothetical protein